MSPPRANRGFATASDHTVLGLLGGGCRRGAAFGWRETVRTGPPRASLSSGFSGRYIGSGLTGQVTRAKLGARTVGADELQKQA